MSESFYPWLRKIEAAETEVLLRQLEQQLEQQLQQMIAQIAQQMIAQKEKEAEKQIAQQMIAQEEKETPGAETARRGERVYFRRSRAGPPGQPFLDGGKELITEKWRNYLAGAGKVFSQTELVIVVEQILQDLYQKEKEVIFWRCVATTEQGMIARPIEEKGRPKKKRIIRFEE